MSNKNYYDRCLEFRARAPVSNRFLFRGSCRALLAEARMRGAPEDEFPIENLLKLLEEPLDEGDKAAALAIPSILAGVWTLGGLFMLKPLWQGEASFYWWSIPWLATAITLSVAAGLGFLALGLSLWDLYDSKRRKPK